MMITIMTTMMLDVDGGRVGNGRLAGSVSLLHPYPCSITRHDKLYQSTHPTVEKIRLIVYSLSL